MGRKTNDPSPREIAAATAVIRSKWTAAEWRKRCHYHAEPITAEIVPAAAFYGESDRKV